MYRQVRRTAARLGESRRASHSSITGPAEVLAPVWADAQTIWRAPQDRGQYPISGTGLRVGITCVSVGGTAVSVAGTGVSVDITGVDVGRTGSEGVAVGFWMTVAAAASGSDETCVAMGVSVSVGVAPSGVATIVAV